MRQVFADHPIGRPFSWRHRTRCTCCPFSRSWQCTSCRLWGRQSFFPCLPFSAWRRAIHFSRTACPSFRRYRYYLFEQPTSPSSASVIPPTHFSTTSSLFLLLHA